MKKLELLAEALGVFAFIMVFIWRLQLFHPWLAIVAPAFTVATHVARREDIRWLGFGSKQFRAGVPLLLAAGSAACLFLAAGSAAGTMRRMTPGEMAMGFAAYIVWGVFQQYLLNGFLANRLAEFTARPRSPLVPLAAAALFALVHLPNWFLMAVTFAGGYLSVRVYQRYRSLYVLGIAHALIAFSLFLAVPDSISGHFLIGPRFVIDYYGAYPEWLL
ncbi:MAG TPA: CPBP family glutamic-type intramembrane protease [Bryobacteraceae bacterium]|nr:CPBP family glutamic-type intramembrane protease [Bryobacteraceae bacterium]